MNSESIRPKSTRNNFEKFGISHAPLGSQYLVFDLEVIVAFVGSKSATRIYGNTRMWLASTEAKVKMTPRSISIYLESSHGRRYGTRACRVEMEIMHAYAPLPYRPPRTLVDIIWKLVYTCRRVTLKSIS